MLADFGDRNYLWLTSNYGDQVFFVLQLYKYTVAYLAISETDH